MYEVEIAFVVAAVSGFNTEEVLKPGEEEAYFPSKKPPNIVVFLFGDDSDQIVDVDIWKSPPRAANVYTRPQDIK